MTNRAPTSSPVPATTEPANATMKPVGVPPSSPRSAASASRPEPPAIISPASVARTTDVRRRSTGVTHESDSAAAGDTRRIRRDPIQPAIAHAGVMVTMGSASSALANGYGMSGIFPRSTRTMRITSAAMVPTVVPTSAPRTPVSVAPRTTAPRSDRLRAPSSRSRAIWERRPASTVSTALTMTIAPTYTAIPMKTVATTPSTAARPPPASSATVTRKTLVMIRTAAYAPQSPETSPTVPSSRGEPSTRLRPGPLMRRPPAR